MIIHYQRLATVHLRADTASRRQVSNAAAHLYVLTIIILTAVILPATIVFLPDSTATYPTRFIIHGAAALNNAVQKPTLAVPQAKQIARTG